MIPPAKLDPMRDYNITSPHKEVAVPRHGVSEGKKNLTEPIIYKGQTETRSLAPTVCSIMVGTVAQLQPIGQGPVRRAEHDYPQDKHNPITNCNHPTTSTASTGNSPATPSLVLFFLLLLASL